MTQDILPQVARGEAQAIERCMDTYGGLVWSLARRYCPDTASAEDAVQEVFLDLWKSAGRYDPTKAKEVTFVAVIARRRLIDRRRAAARRPETLTPDAGQDRAQEGPDALERVEQLELSDRVATAVDELGPPKNQIIRMSVLQGLTHTQIAEQLELPLGTVKTHLRRGLIAVRKQFAEVSNP